MHEGRNVNDFYLARWKGDTVVKYEDSVTKGFQASDFKK